MTGRKKSPCTASAATRRTTTGTWNKYAYLDRDYDVVRLSLYGDHLFPVVDFYNAFDLIVCGGGYNNVWASVYFQKKSIFEPAQLNFSDHETRIKMSETYHFDVNGADQLVSMICCETGVSRSQGAPAGLFKGLRPLNPIEK